MGDNETAYGVDTGFADFTASDESGLRVFYLREDSQTRAIQAFTEEIARAVNVVKRGQKRDTTGKVIGERAAILAADLLSLFTP